MKNYALIFVTIFIFTSCEEVQNSQKPENKFQIQPTPVLTQETGSGSSGSDQGNPKFRTTGIKYYVGCWQPERSFKPKLESKSDIFNITEETIQTSKMIAPVPYEEINSKSNREYFVLHLSNNDKNNNLNSYVYIFMPLDKEMTLSTLESFATENNIKEQATNQWNLRKASCEQFFNQSVKKLVVTNSKFRQATHKNLSEISPILANDLLGAP